MIRLYKRFPCVFVGDDAHIVPKNPTAMKNISDYVYFEGSPYTRRAFSI